MRQEIYQLHSTCARRRIKVSPYGGRVLSFSIGDRNSLLCSGIQVGSTFWPSPQSLWGWPPPEALDSARYNLLETSDKKICLQSGVEHSLGVRVVKTVTPIANGFNIEYTLLNVSQEIVTLAPWEISRVSGGISFYSAGLPPEPHSTCPCKYIKGHYWYEYKPEALQGIPKIFANDTGGWLANVNNGLLLIKRFPQINPSVIAPSEAEVEIYAHADDDNPYIELEQQGEFKAIMPGMEYRWAVDWLLYELPSNLRVAPGSDDLICYLEGVIQPLESVAEVG